VGRGATFSATIPVAHPRNVEGVDVIDDG
jgi:hypothetical protein